MDSWRQKVQFSFLNRYWLPPKKRAIIFPLGSHFNIFVMYAINEADGGLCVVLMLPVAVADIWNSLIIVLALCCVSMLRACVVLRVCVVHNFYGAHIVDAFSVELDGVMLCCRRCRRCRRRRYCLSVHLCCCLPHWWASPHNRSRLHSIFSSIFSPVSLCLFNTCCCSVLLPRPFIVTLFGTEIDKVEVNFQTVFLKSIFLIHPYTHCSRHSFIRDKSGLALALARFIKSISSHLSRL